MKKVIVALIFVLAVLFIAACSTSRYSDRDRDRNGVVIGQGSRNNDKGVLIRKRNRRNRDDNGVIIKKDRKANKANIDNNDQVVIKKKTVKRGDDGDVVIKTRRERRRD